MGHTTPAEKGKKGPLPQASDAQQDDEEWETEHDEEIVGGHERDMTPCENQEFVFANSFDGMLEKSLNFVIFLGFYRNYLTVDVDEVFYHSISTFFSLCTNSSLNLN